MDCFRTYFTHVQTYNNQQHLKPPWGILEAPFERWRLQAPFKHPSRWSPLFKPPWSPLQASFKLKASSPLQAPLKMKPLSSLVQAPSKPPSTLKAFKPPWSPLEAPFKVKPPSSPLWSPLEAPLKPPWSPLQAFRRWSLLPQLRLTQGVGSMSSSLPEAIFLSLLFPTQVPAISSLRALIVALANNLIIVAVLQLHWRLALDVAWLDTCQPSARFPDLHKSPSEATCNLTVCGINGCRLGNWDGQNPGHPWTWAGRWWIRMLQSSSVARTAERLSSAWWIGIPPWTRLSLWSVVVPFTLVVMLHRWALGLWRSRCSSTSRLGYRLYLVKGQTSMLLGRPTMETLGLLMDFHGQQIKFTDGDWQSPTRGCNCTWQVGWRLWTF